MDTIWLLENACGAGAFLLGVTWPLLPTRRMMMLAQLAASILFASYFFLSGAVSGAAIGVIFSLQCVLALPERRPAWAGLVYLGSFPAAIAVTIATWQGMASIGAMIAIFSATLSRWQLNPQIMRLTFFGVVLGWGLHNFISHTWYGLAADTVTVLTLTGAILRERFFPAGPFKPS